MNLLKELWKSFTWTPLGQAERIEEICSQSVMPCSNFAEVAVSIRKGVLRHPAAISAAMDSAMKADYAIYKREGKINQ